MKEVLPLALVLLLTSAASAMPSLPKFDLESDDCAWFKKAADVFNLQPFELGFSYAVSDCVTGNKYCEKLSQYLKDVCVNKHGLEFYNALSLGVDVGALYNLGIMSRYIASAKLSAKFGIPRLDAKSDVCTDPKAIAKKLNIQPFGLGVTLSLFCNPSNNFCEKIIDLIQNVCVPQDIDFYNPLLAGFEGGAIYMAGIGAIHKPKASVPSILSAMPRLDAKSNDCSLFTKITEKTHLGPYMLGYLYAPFLCDPSNNYCEELLDFVVNTCVNKLKPNFYIPLAVGMNIGTTLVKAITEHIHSHEAILSKIPRLDTKSDDCSWFQKISKKTYLQPYDLGLTLTVFCDPDNDYCQQLQDFVNNVCSHELPPNFHNPLSAGLAVGGIYMRGIFTNPSAFGSCQADQGCSQ